MLAARAETTTEMSSTALALAMPETVPQRDLLVGAVFGIVLVTVLVQGTTAGLVVRWAGIPSGSRRSPPPDLNLG